MAYRAPRYSYVHAARGKASAAFSISGTAHADFPKANLNDDRASTLFKWSTTVTDPYIILNMGNSYPTGLSRLIIPANHNIEALYVDEDAGGSFSSPTPLHALPGDPDTTVAGELIDLTFDTANSSVGFIRLGIIGGPTQFYLPQLVFTKVFAPTIGPVLGNAVDTKRANVTRLVQPTGISPTIQHGPQQRYLEYEYEYPLSSTDLTSMEDLVATVGMSSPFFVDPASFSTPPETDEPALWMKFAEMPEARLSVLVPASNERAKTYRLRLIESLD